MFELNPISTFPALPPLLHCSRPSSTFPYGPRARSFNSHFKASWASGCPQYETGRRSGDHQRTLRLRRFGKFDMQPVENNRTKRFVMNTQTQTHTNRTGGAAQANNLVVLLSGVRNEFSGVDAATDGGRRSQGRQRQPSPLKSRRGPNEDEDEEEGRKIGKSICRWKWRFRSETHHSLAFCSRGMHRYVGIYVG